MEAELIQEEVKKHTPVALSYARKFSTNSKYDREDLDQAALEGLVEAVISFSPEKSANGLVSWAYPFIKNKVLHEVHRKQFPYLTFSAFLLRKSILDTFNRLNRSSDAKVSNQLIADELDISVEDVSSVLSNAAICSLDDSDFPGYEVELDYSVLVEQLATLAENVLTDEEHFILVRRLGLDGLPEALLTDLSAITGLSRQTVKNRFDSAISKLKIETIN